MAVPTTTENTKDTSANAVKPQPGQYDFGGAVISYLGVPDTLGNRWFLLDWARVENTKAKYNPLATTLNEPGATTFNSVGVKNYPDPATGAKATADTIKNYPNIVAALQTGSPKVSGITAGLTHDFGIWVSGPQGIGTKAWQDKATQYTRAVFSQTESGDPYSGFGVGNYPIGKNNDPAQVAGRAASGLANDVLSGLGLNGLAKDALYIAILIGGGLVLLTGLVLIGADIGLAVFAKTKAAQKTQVIVNNLPGNRRAQKNDSQRSYGTSREGISQKDKTKPGFKGVGRAPKKSKPAPGEPGSTKLAKGDSIPF